MEPVHLRTYELNYELRVRNVIADRVDIAMKRKYLRRELKKDSARPEAHVYTTPNFDFDLEKRELNDSIKSVTELVNDYDGVNLELGNRIRSRINHILGRLGRIPDNIGDEISNFRGDNIIIVSTLEEDLDELIQKYTEGEARPRSVSNSNEASTHTSAHKSVPVYKWPVKFTGRSDKASLNSFLQRVDELRIARRCSEDELFQAASDLFEDNALEWYRAQIRQRRFDTWDSLVKALKEDFLPRDYDKELWKQIEKRTQHAAEPVVIYISVMENLFECLTEKPSEELKLKTLMSHVLPEYQNHLVLQNIQDVNSLLRICRSLEDSEKIKKEFRPPPIRDVCALEPCLVYSNSDQGESSGAIPKSREKHFKERHHQVLELHCWNCNEVGHVKRNCWKSKRIPSCHGCQRPGVIRPNCPTCKRSSKNDRAENAT